MSTPDNKRIAVSKAAKLIGISRGELNKRLLAAGIETFEGEVELERVKCIAPSLDPGASAVMERVRFIRDNVSKPLGGDSIAMTNQNLGDEVRRLSSELMVEAQMAAHYRQVLEDIGHKLGELQTSNDPHTRDLGFELCQWLRDKITSN